MKKRLVEVNKEVQDAFSADLDALCEKYSVKIMPTMFIVQEVDDIEEETPAEPVEESPVVPVESPYQPE
jgi:hypothetical protein